MVMHLFGVALREPQGGSRGSSSVLSLRCAGWVCGARHTSPTGQFQDFNAESPQSYFFIAYVPHIFHTVFETLVYSPF